MHAHPQHTRGFTLMELLVSMAIMAILLLIATPLYTGWAAEARRGDAQATLMRLQLSMETWRASHDAYTDVIADMEGSSPDTAYYQFSITLADGEAYTLNATAQGSQATQDAECSPLTLNQAGEKSPSACWKS